MSDKKDPLERIEIKIDNMSEKIHSMDKSLIIYNEHLSTHMRRTELAEKKLDLFEQEIKPALEGYKFVKTALKILVPILITCIGWYIHIKFR